MALKNKERNLRWVSLYEQGWSFAEIGREYGVSRTAVHLVVTRLGVNTRSRVYHRALRDAERELGALRKNEEELMEAIVTLQCLIESTEGQDNG